MPNKEQFPHIPLLWVRDAPPKTVQRPIPSPTQTSENLSNRALHHRKMEGAIQRLLEDDRLVKNDRLQQALPSIDDHIALFLQIDGQKLKVDDLRKYDIEIIAELDDGFIIGCSPDLTLSALRKKIDKFLGGKQNDVAGLYNLNEGFGWRPE